MPQTIIFIGAGHGVAQLVESLRGGGFEGNIIMIGDEAHRPYDRPATSKELLSGGIEMDRVFLKREQFYTDKNIDVRLSTAAPAIDRHAKTVTPPTGETLSYDTLVIATGARARRLTVPGADLDGIFYLRSLADSQAIGARLGPGKRLAITGAGYLGTQGAARRTQPVCQVTVIEALERPLARVAGAEIADFYTAAHKAHGVDLHFGVVVAGF